MAEVVHVADGSPEWHELRRTRIGASEIGAICGWSPWDDADSIAARKADGPTPTTPRQQLGHDAEPMLLDWLARKLDQTVERHPGTWIDDLAVANPDGRCADGWLVECKTVDDRSTEAGWGRAGTDQVPLHYQAQCVWQAGMTEAPGVHLVALAGALNGRVGLHVAHYVIPAQPAIYAHMRHVAQQWHATHFPAADAA